MRLFVAIPLADAVARELCSVIERLREGESTGPESRLRWTSPESWHITLQFLGNATPEQLECLRVRLGEVSASAIPVKLGELGCFDRAGVFFANVTVTPALAALEGAWWRRLACADSRRRRGRFIRTLRWHGRKDRDAEPTCAR